MLYHLFENGELVWACCIGIKFINVSFCSCPVQHLHELVMTDKKYHCDLQFVLCSTCMFFTTVINVNDVGQKTLQNIIDDENESIPIHESG